MTNPTTEARDALLPCPFCGGEAEPFRENETGSFPLVAGHPLQITDIETFYGIRCQKCEIGNRNCWVDQDRAITAWNTRTPTPLPAADSGWRDIASFSEPTALLSGNGVLIATPDGFSGEAYFRNFDDDDRGWWWVNTSWGDYPTPERPLDPTHWMPLPTAPDRAA